MARYTIRPEESTVTISARSSVHPIHTEAHGLEGWLDLDLDHTTPGRGRVDLGAAPAAHLEFPVENLRSGNPLEDRELRRRIDAGRFPRIIGDLTSMRGTDEEGRYLVAGDLTFRGVSDHHEDEIRLTVVDARTIRLEGESTFDVRDHGMEPPRILLLRVHPDVRVAIDITAERDDDTDG